MYFGVERVREGITEIFFGKGREKRIVVNYGGRKFDTVILAKILLELGHAPKIVSKGRSIFSLSLNNTTVKDLNCYVSAFLCSIST